MPALISPSKILTPTITKELLINIAKRAIEAKHASLGGNTSIVGAPGPTDGVLPCPDQDGYFRRYAHGMIYWRPSSGAYEIHGAILEKWAALGYERGFLGYPIGDELPTPDHVGAFTRFQGGMIYWSPATGAHEVYGSILERWASLGYELSWLGYPTSDEMDFSFHPEMGRVSSFQNGAIYWWPDTGAIELKDVVVHYTGLRCFGETDWDQGSAEDEPYCIFTVGSPMATAVSRTRIYENVNSGDTRADLLEIYRGKPYGLVIGTKLLEHDYSNPDDYLEDIKKLVHEAYAGAAAVVGFIPIVGPALAGAASPLLTKLETPTAEAINRALDLGDDELAAVVMRITPKEMVLLATRTPNSVDVNIGFKLVTPLLSGDGASYKAFFGVVPA